MLIREKAAVKMGATQRLLGFFIAGLGVIVLLLLLFVKTDADENAAELCKELHGDTGEEFEPCPLHRGGDSWVMVLAFSIISIVVVIGVIMIMSQQAGNSKKTFVVEDATFDE